MTKVAILTGGVCFLDRRLQVRSEVNYRDAREVNEGLNGLLHAHLKRIIRAACLTATRQCRAEVRQFMSMGACNDSGTGGDKASTIAAQRGAHSGGWGAGTFEVHRCILWQPRGGRRFLVLLGPHLFLPACRSRATRSCQPATAQFHSWAQGCPAREPCHHLHISPRGGDNHNSARWEQGQLSIPGTVHALPGHQMTDYRRVLSGSQLHSVHFRQFRSTAYSGWLL